MKGEVWLGEKVGRREKKLRAKFLFKAGFADYQCNLIRN